jgi:colanic acid/amylovoran biosynthesis glycosyltransferase
MDSRKTVILYRDELLGTSETFIRAQAESLSRFQAFYLGLRRIPGLEIPIARSHIVSRKGLWGKIKRARFKLLGAGASLKRKLAELRPALIHAHFGPDACNVISLAHSLQIPLVVTFHGYDVTVADNRMPRLYVQRRDQLKKSGARFLCISQFIRDRVVAKGFPEAQTLVHYTGIDTEFFSPDPAVVRSPIVLFVGRLVPVKGCEYLIRAMARVQAVLPEAQLVVIGDGELRVQLEQQAAGSLKNFIFVGAQDPTAVKQWMNRAMVFCTPSVKTVSGAEEGFGMVFVESQSMGLPVVSFASGGIPEGVAHEQTGFLVTEKDWEALASKILLLLTDQKLWLQFSEAGQARARLLFDVRKQVAALEHIYESVMLEQRQARIGLHAGATKFEAISEITKPSLGIAQEPIMETKRGSQ